MLLLAIDLYKDREYTINLLMESMSVSFYLYSYSL